MGNFYSGYMTIETSDHSLAEQTGKTIASVLAPKNKKNPLVVVGHDGGASAGMIYDSVCRGICSSGSQAEKLGVLIPPVVSCITGLHDADAGIMITSQDSTKCGIQLYSSGGHKLSHETWLEVKRIIFKSPEELEKRTRLKKGGVIICENATDEYIRHILSFVTGDFSGMKISVSGNNTGTAEKIFSSLGIELTPDNSDCGIFFSEDCECIMVTDEKGDIISNDRLSAVIAGFCKENNLLKNDTFVVTCNAGYGLIKFAEEHNISLVTAGFDEKSVVSRMIADGYNYGTDNRGRIIFLDDMPAGDGIFTALKLLAVMRRKALPLSRIAGVKHYPSFRLDVDIPPRFREIWKNDCVITEHIARYTHLFGNRAKLSVHEDTERPSINITAEGMDYKIISEAVNTIADKIRERIS